MDFNFFGLQKDHNYTFSSPIAEGPHSVYVKCKDDSDNVMYSSLLINFVVDTAPPAITVSSPGPRVLGEFTDINISTNEDSECRYDRSDDDFDDMKEFDITYGRTFSNEITGLSEDNYIYYVKCKDSLGNIAEKEISFSAALPPSAEITIEKQSPLNKGTYELRLYPSKKLRSVPQLSYTFTDDSDGFDGKTYDFEVLVPTDKSTGQAVYYFYVELA